MPFLEYQNIADFLLDNRDYLYQDEIKNHLLLSIALYLQNNPDALPCKPMLIASNPADRVRVVVLMTPPHLMLLTGQSLCPTDLLLDLIEFIRSKGWTLPGVMGITALAKRFAEIWTSTSSDKSIPGMEERLYKLSEVAYPEPTQGKMRLATSGDAPQIVDWVRNFHQEAIPQEPNFNIEELIQKKITNRDIFLWEDTEPVSLASRSRPTDHGIVINLVYTPPDQRQRGYATNLVAHLSQYLLDLGYDFCCLFTNLANKTSNSIYQKVGYKPVTDFQQIYFRK
ncbi:MAG: GNAT family N-acetyltransferase [Candidatus Cloacimonetes bacterium]|nr:GNAT family N-acetyltransferase [Candidatus Cloacimonadota bacterium]